MMTLSEALRLIRDPELTHDKDKGLAGCVLYENYRHLPGFTIADMLRCLDYRGTIAEVGARCLHTRTGRKECGEKMVMDRKDWESYLSENSLARIPEAG